MGLLEMMALATATHMTEEEIGPGMAEMVMEDITVTETDAVEIATDDSTAMEKRSGPRRKKRHGNSRPCRTLQANWTRIAATGWPRLPKRIASPEMQMIRRGNAMAIERSRMDCIGKPEIWSSELEWDATSMGFRKTTIEARAILYITH